LINVGSLCIFTLATIRRDSIYWLTKLFLALT